MVRVALQLQVAVVAGTGAGAFKLAPVIAALRRRIGIGTTVILSGEQALARGTLAGFGLAIDTDLAIGGKRDGFCAALDHALAALLPRIAPDLLLVLGDSDTAWTAAHVANRIGVPIAHAEAGLRSGHLDLPWPEERNREEIDRMSALLLTPCARATRAVADLPGQIRETGSSAVDAVLAALGDRPPPTARSGPRRIFVACLRADAERERLAAALARVAAHSDVFVAMAGPASDFADWVRALAEADLLLTDDGTLQEAAAAIGVPTLMLGSTTARWDMVDAGQTLIVGRDPVRIRGEVEALLDDPARHAAMARPCEAYGDGTAAERIAEAIARWASPKRAAAAESPPALPLMAALF